VTCDEERDALAELLDDSYDREKALGEDNLRLEALVRDKDEAIGELLELAEYQPEPVVVYRRLGA
jgi:hypothetical protein